MELSEDEFLSAFVEAHHAPVLMNFSFWILRLRVIGALVLHVQKLVVQNEAVFTLNLRHARLAFPVPSQIPTSGLIGAQASERVGVWAVPRDASKNSAATVSLIRIEIVLSIQDAC